MIELKDIKKVYFIGIGGIGMSALARYFRSQQKAVSGYDKTATPLTRQLETEGITVHYEENLDLAPRDADLVIYTPAVPKDHQELIWYQQHSYPLMKRSEVLGLITKSSFNICVAGTHGKTTISTMIAHLLRHSGYGCNAFLGGISVNYGSNFWTDPRNVCVVEADEYDRSFLRLFPDMAVISAMDADHLDIYGTAAEMEQAFIDFSGNIKSGGVLLSKSGLSRSAELKGDRHLSYGIGESLTGQQLHTPAAGSASSRLPDACATRIRVTEGSYSFSVKMPDWQLDEVLLHMGGLHNVENATVAIAIAHLLGIADDKIRDAVAAFKGVRRRFEYILRQPGLVFIDDYAHHPEELRALITGARGLYPGLKCTVIFQPHLFSRTRDFADGFAESLGIADEVYLLPIYPARELPIAGVTSELIAGKMEKNKVKLTGKEDLINSLSREAKETRQLQLVITAGAGDIDALVQPIRMVLEQ